jgi:hypothetical protein
MEQQQTMSFSQRSQITSVQTKQNRYQNKPLNCGMLQTSRMADNFIVINVLRPTRLYRYYLKHNKLSDLADPKTRVHELQQDVVDRVEVRRQIQKEGYKLVTVDGRQYIRYNALDSGLG